MDDIRSMYRTIQVNKDQERRTRSRAGIERKGGVASMTLQEVLFFRVKAEGEWFHELKLQNLQDGWNASRALETAQAEARYWSYISAGGGRTGRSVLEVGWTQENKRRREPGGSL